MEVVFIASGYYGRNVIPSFNQARELEREGLYEDAISRYQFCLTALSAVGSGDSDLAMLVETGIAHCEDMKMRNDLLSFLFFLG